MDGAILTDLMDSDAGNSLQCLIRSYIVIRRFFICHMPIAEVEVLVFSKIKNIKDIGKVITPFDKRLVVWSNKNIIRGVA